jgi:hypothetical protein
MSNNKQSSVEWLRKKLFEKMQVWNSTKNYQEFHIVLEAGEFAKLIDEAKAMHKKEIIIARSTGLPIEDGVFTAIDKAHKYYNETFGGNNEQRKKH